MSQALLAAIIGRRFEAMTDTAFRFAILGPQEPSWDDIAGDWRRHVTLLLEGIRGPDALGTQDAGQDHGDEGDGEQAS